MTTSYPKYTWAGNRISPEDMAALHRAKTQTRKHITLMVAEAVSRYVKEVVPDMKEHRKLTTEEYERMLNVYACAPLLYRPEIDDALMELDLIEFYDGDAGTDAVDAKHGTDFFFKRNGSVRPEWYEHKH